MRTGYPDNKKNTPPGIVAIGEALVDFVPEKNGYVLRPGGAPSNVAVNLSRMGIKAGIISKVGRDFLGRFLLNFLKKSGVDISAVKTTKKAKTGLVFVFHNKYGERDFSFYGSPSADTLLSEREINDSYIKGAGILHFGSISMMAEQSRKAVLKAVKRAKKHGLLVSYDPNLRLNLWEGREGKAAGAIKKYFKYADIIKMSEDEERYIYGGKITVKNFKKFFRPDKIVVISSGKKGARFISGGYSGRVRGVKARAVDTTGAGDAFMAGLLRGILITGKKCALTKKEFAGIIKYANRAGAAAVRRKGAV